MPPPLLLLLLFLDAGDAAADGDDPCNCIEAVLALLSSGIASRRPREATGASKRTAERRKRAMESRVDMIKYVQEFNALLGTMI